LHVDKDIPYIMMSQVSKFAYEDESIVPRGLIMTCIGENRDTYRNAYIRGTNSISNNLNILLKR
jgi:hypothetical protein